MEPEEREGIAERITKDLYLCGYIETLFNTTDERFKKGWLMKNFKWSPWYLNLRPIGATPHIVSDITYAMNHILQDEIPGLSQIVGVEMAGVPLVSAVATAHGPGCRLFPYSYTRPFPRAKPRTPAEAEEALKKLVDVHGYGHKELVEGRFEDGDKLCIFDDMVTSFGSKLIAKIILEHELERRGVTGVDISDVAVVLDRGQGAEEEAEKHGMRLHSLIKFKSKGLGWLKDRMLPQEYELISDYQENPAKYQDKELQQEVVEEAAKHRAV